MGQVVSLEKARVRFAPRIAARERRREAQRPLEEARERARLEASKRYWLADLKTWPRAFYVRLAPYIKGMTKVDVCSGPYQSADWDAYIPAIRRGRASMNAEDVEKLVRSLARAAHDSGARLPFHRDRLLWAMWIQWVRRLERRQDTWWVKLQMEKFTRYGPTLDLPRLCDQRERHSGALAAGVTRNGPNAGKAMPRSARTRLQNDIAICDQWITYVTWELEHVLPWAEGNPVKFALGCLPRSIREKTPRKPKRRGRRAIYRASVLVAAPGVVGAGDLLDVVGGQLAVRAVDHGAELARIEEERLAPAIAEAAVLLGAGEEPETDRDLRRVEELAGERDHAVDEVGLDHGLADLALAGLVGRHRAVGEHEAGDAVRCQVV